ncbi:MAG: 30S ribosome-binding factor RbfA [Clostridiales bacterium]|jgi:ribosome-binding factor A|nr:30S ribosome-binding factor RbfA [Clostridiales bacterium]
MTHRTQRLGSEMRKSLSEIIRSKVKDPRLTDLVSVMAVELTADLKFAKVFISVYGGEQARADALAALNHSAGYIRGELAADFKAIRTVPKLTFLPDHSMDYGAKIDSILQDLNKEQDHDREEDAD